MNHLPGCVLDCCTLRHRPGTGKTLGQVGLSALNPFHILPRQAALPTASRTLNGPTTAIRLHTLVEGVIGLLNHEQRDVLKNIAVVQAKSRRERTCLPAPVRS